MKFLRAGQPLIQIDVGIDNRNAPVPALKDKVPQIKVIHRGIGKLAVEFVRIRARIPVFHHQHRQILLKGRAAVEFRFQPVQRIRLPADAAAGRVETLGPAARTGAGLRLPARGLLLPFVKIAENILVDDRVFFVLFRGGIALLPLFEERLPRFGRFPGWRVYRGLLGQRRLKDQGEEGQNQRPHHRQQGFFEDNDEILVVDDLGHAA